MGWGAANYDYKAHVYLSSDEKAHGRELLGAPTRPILTFHTRSKEEVKNWPMESWHAVLALFRDLFHLVHIGDSSEPVIEGVQRFAGRLSLRESMSVLSHAHVHMGADSFLMHAANGLDVPSVIIFGGSRTPANLGYTGNVNLFASMPCGPCWLQPSRGEQCLHGIACMGKIHVEEVVTAVRRLAAQEPRAPK
jgi:ADP-heptose:LPS heptosyltransferase